MTSLQNRPDTALIVIDMQRSVVADAFEVDRVVDDINQLVDKARIEQHHSPPCTEPWPVSTTPRWPPTLTPPT